MQAHTILYVNCLICSWSLLTRPKHVMNVISGVLDTVARVGQKRIPF